MSSLSSHCFCSSLDLRKASRALSESASRPAEAVDGEGLGAGRDHLRIDLDRLGILLEGQVLFAELRIHQAQVVMRHRLVGDEFCHLLELLHRILVAALLLEGDAEIEPGVRNRRILLLGFLEFDDSGLDFVGLHQREAVVEPFAEGVGRQLESLLELTDRLVLLGRILVVRLTEVAVMPEFLGIGGTDQKPGRTQEGDHQKTVSFQEHVLR